MRKEIPLLITGIVGIVLILQYFSPNKSINGLEDTFTQWMQIIASFSMILGVLNLIRVNGDKIYKKRKNWGFSVIIIVSLFATLIVGFANIGSEAMYDRKVLKTNSGVIGNITKDVMEQNGIKFTDKNFDPIFKALVDATQKEKTISSILPESIKSGELRKKFDKMLPIVRKRSQKSIEIVDDIGRKVNKEIKNTLKRINSKDFIVSLGKVYDDLKKDINSKSKEMGLTSQDTLYLDIFSQVNFVLSNYEKVNINFKYYGELKEFIKELNNYITKDEDLKAKLKENISESKSYEDFYKKSLPLFKLKKETPYYKFLLSNLIDTYLNNIYTYKLNENTLKAINQSLKSNEELIKVIADYISEKYIEEYKKGFKKYFSNYETYVTGNKYIKDNSVVKLIYNEAVGNMFSVGKKELGSFVAESVNSPVILKKIKSDKKLIDDIIKNNKDKITSLGLSEKSSDFVMRKLLESGGEFKLATLAVGSSFMEIYRYIFTPLSSTMFALLAFFVASASYRAFRARNKEATLLLVSGFLVMLGAVPIGEVLSIKGVFSVSEVSDFIMNVPVMSVQSGIMIGVALGVISTSLRLILGIERSHLGGD